MARYPRAHALAYSFGPGPITPAVSDSAVANVGVYVATLIFPAIAGLARLDPAGRDRAPLAVAAGHVHVPARATTSAHPVQHARRSGCSAWSWSGVGHAVLREVLLRHRRRCGRSRPSSCRSCPSRRRAPSITSNTSAPRARSTACCSRTRCTIPNRPILMFLFFPVPAKYFVMILGAIAFLIVDLRERHRRRTPRTSAAARRLHLPEHGTGRFHAPRSSTATSSGR